MDTASPKTESQTLTLARRVISLHGIRTTGAWQKELTDALEEHHLRYSPFDYGHFKLAMFIRPKRRDKEIDRFRDWVTKYINSEQPPSVIAHSFGTYIVAKALYKYEELKLDRLILCGSIIHEDYDWSKIAERGQVRKVLNESGSKDVWSKLVAFLVKDGGPSGVDGFSDKVNGLVADIHRSGFRHSDFFYSLHVQNVWIPFINGQDVTELAKVGKSKRPTNAKFLITQIALLIIILFLAILGWYNHNHSPQTFRTEATPIGKFKQVTSSDERCPFGGEYKMREDKSTECIVMEINPATPAPKFHRTEGQLFFYKEGVKCPSYQAVFAQIRGDGNRCIIEAPNNITLYHTLNTIYYSPFPKPKGYMEKIIGWDLYGDDYRDFPVKGSGSEDICLNECAIDEKCQAFSFSTTANRCWLKDKIPQDKFRVIEIVSGRKDQSEFSPKTMP